MRKIIVAIAAALLIMVGMPVLTTQAAHATTNPRVIGHRGATGVAGYPEQSLAALGYAKTYGAVVAEGDVRFTSDDYAVMAHNDQAPGCTGTISGRTFADLRTCAGSSVLPQLLFWLREAKRLGMGANVELKGSSQTDHQLEVFRRTVVDEAPTEMYVASFYPEPLARAKAVLGSRARYAPLIAPTGSPFGYSVADHASKYDVIMPDFSWLIVARVGWYHDAGVEVIGWTGNSDTDDARMRALNLDGMVIDDAKDYKEYLNPPAKLIKKR